MKNLQLHKIKKSSLIFLFLFCSPLFIFSQFSSTYTWLHTEDVSIKFNVPEGADIHQVVLDVFTNEDQGDIGITGYPSFKIFRPDLLDADSPLAPTWNASTYTGTCSYGGDFSGATIEIQEINKLTDVAAPNTGNYRFKIRYKPLGSGDYGSCGTNDDWIIVINGLNNPSENSIDVSVGSRTTSTYSSGTLNTTLVLIDLPPQPVITLPEPEFTPTDLNPIDVNQLTGEATDATITFAGQHGNDGFADLVNSECLWKYNSSSENYNITTPPTVPVNKVINLNEGLTNVSLEITEILRTHDTGDIKQTGTANIYVILKKPPEVGVNVTSIGDEDPLLSDPPVGDVPTKVSLTTIGIVHYDPVVEPEPESFYDDNETDYEIVRWEIQKEGYAVPIEITPRVDNHEFVDDLAIIESGKHRIKVIIEDDYGIQGEGYADVYVAPIEKMVFPPHQGVPFDNDEPDIDGVLDYFDVDGDGVRDPVDDPDSDDDLFEHGWTGSYRLTYENGAYPPNIAFQGTRSRYTSQPYLYLSFEVRNDPTFDDEDVIVLTFRGDANSIELEDDRKIFIFPVSTNIGASDGLGGPDDLDPSVEKYNKPPHLIEYWKRSGYGWEEVTAITSSTAGFDVKVWSKTEGVNSLSYDVEIQVPTNKIAGGTDWIDFEDDFLFYFNVIRIDSTDSENLIAVENTWPRDLPIDYLAQGNLHDYPFPPLVWGKSFKTTTDECRGVSLEAWNDIGIDDGSAVLSDLMSLTEENRFVARVTNNSEKVIEHPLGSGNHSAEPVIANDVRATFRIAHWGVVGQDGDWREIPAGDNPTSFQDIPAGAGNTESVYEFQTLWELAPTDAGFYAEHLHQCIKVELDSSGNTNILKKGVARNMDFDPVASEFFRVARISTVGFGLPPEGEDKHSVILQVSTKYWEKNADPVRGLKSGNQISGIDSHLSYIVNGYIDTGRVIIINKKSCKIYAPMGSFGYVIYHDGEVKDWRHGIEGAEEVALNTYKLEIEPESYKDIVTRIEPIEPCGISLSLHAGAASPVVPSAFANDYSTGFCVFGDLGYKLSNQWSIISLFGYNYFPAKTTGIDDTSIINIALNIKRFFPVPNRPKFTLGIGVGPEMFIQDFATIDWGYDLDLSLGYKINKTLTFEGGVVYHSNIDQENWFIQTHGGIVINF